MIDFKNETVRKRLITIVQLIILVAIVVWLARSFKREDWETLKNQDKNWWLLLGSVMIVLAGHMISYLRWMILVRALDVPLSIAEAIRLGFIGHMFSLVAAGSVGGDLFKAIAVAKRRETRRPEVIASVIMDRAVGLLGLVLLTCVCLGFQTTGGLSEPLLIIRRGAWVCLLIGVCVLTLVVVAGKRVPLNSLVHLPIVGRLIHRMWHFLWLNCSKPNLP